MQPGHFYELLEVLVYRNLKVRYRGSILGIYWSMLNPLLITAVYTVVFGTTFASYYDNSIIKYVMAVFTGISVVNFFAGATSQALTSLVSNGALLNKIQLHVELFPISMITANVFQFFVGTFPVLAILAYLNSRDVRIVMALLLPLIALVIISLGVGLVLSALFVFFRDLPYFYDVLMYALRVGTPVFYPSEIVPEKVRNFLALNPLSIIIESVRSITLLAKLPDLDQVGTLFVMSAIILFAGWLFFCAWKNQYMDLL